tara:strand:+ start:17448 stop:18389 length:942 start_codon:yes stop_codon:yes gene_type:complete
MGKSRLKSRRRTDPSIKWTRIVIGILGTIGVIDTGTITLNKFGFIGSLSCPGGVEGCDKVLNSPWGTIFQANNYSIPLSLAGFSGYLLVLLLAIVPFFPGLTENKNELSRYTWWGIFFVSCGMTVFSFLLLGIMIFKINAFCFFCVLSALISLLILILTLIGGGWEDFGDLMFKGIIFSIIILLSGFIWSSSVDPSQQETSLNTQGIAPPVETISSSSSISLAKHLSSKGITMYNAYWCPHCHEQKEMFGKEAVSELLLVECAKDGKNNQSSLCEAKGITGFPSWEINGKIESGVKSLQELAASSNYNGSTDF